MIISTDSSDGLVKLDGEELEGVLQSLSVNGEVIIDSNNSASNNQPQKVMRGYKDKSVSITLLIVEKEDKTVYEILEEIENIFQDKEDNIPKVFTLFNKHTVARGIDEVVFTGLSSAEDNSTDTLALTLKFEEFVSARYT